MANEAKKSAGKKEAEELHTDFPLSEKDEVKEAEERGSKRLKKTDESVAADLKSRSKK